jgi:hypothetical protein
MKPPTIKAKVQALLDQGIGDSRTIAETLGITVKYACHCIWEINNAEARYRYWHVRHREKYTTDAGYRERNRKKAKAHYQKRRAQA